MNKIAERVGDLGWSFASWFTGIPKEQLMCSHPEYARDYKMRMIAEENGMDFYEQCLKCNKEFHEKRKKR